MSSHNENRRLGRRCQESLGEVTLAPSNESSHDHANNSSNNDNCEVKEFAYSEFLSICEGTSTWSPLTSYEKEYRIDCGEFTCILSQDPSKWTGKCNKIRRFNISASNNWEDSCQTCQTSKINLKTSHQLLGIQGKMCYLINSEGYRNSHSADTVHSFLESESVRYLIRGLLTLVQGSTALICFGIPFYDQARHISQVTEWVVIELYRSSKAEYWCRRVRIDRKLEPTNHSGLFDDDYVRNHDVKLVDMSEEHVSTKTGVSFSLDHQGDAKIAPNNPIQTHVESSSEVFEVSHNQSISKTDPYSKNSEGSSVQHDDFSYLNSFSLQPENILSDYYNFDFSRSAVAAPLSSSLSYPCPTSFLQLNQSSHPTCYNANSSKPSSGFNILPISNTCYSQQHIEASSSSFSYPTTFLQLNQINHPTCCDSNSSKPSSDSNILSFSNTINFQQSNEIEKTVASLPEVDGLRSGNNSETSYICPDVKCDKKFDSKKKLKAHSKTHLSDRPRHPCSSCNNTFSRPGDVNRHNKEVHGKNKRPRKM